MWVYLVEGKRTEQNIFGLRSSGGVWDGMSVCACLTMSVLVYITIACMHIYILHVIEYVLYASKLLINTAFMHCNCVSVMYIPVYMCVFSVFVQCGVCAFRCLVCLFMCVVCVCMCVFGVFVLVMRVCVCWCVCSCALCVCAGFDRHQFQRRRPGGVGTGLWVATVSQSGTGAAFQWEHTKKETLVSA